MSAAQEQIQIWSLLVKAPHYRAFLQSYIDWKKSKKRNFGYASFAREAGFAARSYPRDVINGSRQLTASSIPRFVKAMKLTNEAVKYFQLLACQERPQLLDISSTKEDVAKQLCQSREKLIRQIENRNNAATKTTPKVFAQNYWPLIYASLGSEKQGASIEDISSRSRFSVDVCVSALNQMAKADVVRYCPKSKRYFMQNSHLIFQDLKENESFQSFFISSLRRAENKAKQSFNSEDRLFFASAVSMKKNQLHKYRKKLRDLLNSFAEEAEDANGEDIATIVCGFFPS
jgi:uncharacterized protein (TIGR02147 family)